MTEIEAYQEYIRCKHNAFCKAVIRYAAIGKIIRLRQKWEREVSLDYLTNEKFVQFAEPEQFEEYFFTACGQTAVLYHAELAAARDAGSSSWMKPPAPRTQPTPMPSRAACCATRP